MFQMSLQAVGSGGENSKGLADGMLVHFLHSRT